MSLYLRTKLQEQNSEELETLQTDVMRFMAIIAFCLLVIFIPLAKNTTNVQQKTLNENLALKQEIQTLNSKILASDKTISQINISHQNEVNELVKKLKQEKNKVHRLEKQMLTTKVVNKVKQVSKVKPKKTKQQKVKPIKKPLKIKKNIKFSNARTLLSLIKKQKLEAYIYISKIIYKVQLKNNSIVFIKQSKVDLSSNTYIMPYKNIPSKIINNFQQYYGNLSEKNWKFYIKLDDKVNFNLKNQLKSNKGGDYIIQSSGKVKYVL